MSTPDPDANSYISATVIHHSYYVWVTCAYLASLAHSLNTRFNNEWMNITKDAYITCRKTELLYVAY